MANKINVKLIMELKAAGMSQNTIAKTRHVSTASVSDVLHIACEKHISYEDIKDKSDDEAYRLFYPNKFAVETMFRQPDYAYVHNELKKVGVTLKLLWQEYKDTCNKEGGNSGEFYLQLCPISLCIKQPILMPGFSGICYRVSNHRDYTVFSQLPHNVNYPRVSGIGAVLLKGKSQDGNSGLLY